MCEGPKKGKYTRACIIAVFVKPSGDPVREDRLNKWQREAKRDHDTYTVSYREWGLASVPDGGAGWLGRHHSDAVGTFFGPDRPDRYLGDQEPRLWRRSPPVQARPRGPAVGGVL